MNRFKLYPSYENPGVEWLVKYRRISLGLLFYIRHRKQLIQKMYEIDPSLLQLFLQLNTRTTACKKRGTR